MTRLEPGQGIAAELATGGELTVVTPGGGQVADLVAFASGDPDEWLSSGRTIDYCGTLRIREGHTLYSNRSRAMLVIEEDRVGRNDFLYAACSREMFERQYGKRDHVNCVDALVAALASFGITADGLPTPFNVFMTVDVGPDGQLAIRPPAAPPGARVRFRAAMDVVVAISACPAEVANGGTVGSVEVHVV